MMACNKLLFLVGGKSHNNLYGHKTQPLCPPAPGREGDGLQILGSNMTTKSWDRKFNSRNEEEEEFQSQTALAQM